MTTHPINVQATIPTRQPHWNLLNWDHHIELQRLIVVDTLLLNQYTGRIRREEIEQAFHANHAMLRNSPLETVTILADYTHVTAIRFSFQDGLELLHLVQDFPVDMIMLVFSTNGIVNKILQMVMSIAYQRYNIKFILFSSVEDAKRFFGETAAV